MNPITYSYSGGIVTYNVTVTGSYTIVAIGAGGGTGFGGAGAAGNGAEIGGTFNLTAGQSLNIIVGGAGGSGTRAGGGGGGFSEVYTTDGNGNISPLLVAGGGGGGGNTNTLAGSGTVGNAGGGGGGGGGGANGGGGGAGNTQDGFAGTSNGGSGGGGGSDAAHGGLGGTAGSSGNNYAPGAGGFGGGGGGGSFLGFNNNGGGGGGGGYTGGFGGGSGVQGASGGGGGSSYLDATRGTQTLAVGGFRAGAGNVLITAPAAPVQPAAPAPCYVTGTRIRVLRGHTIQDVAVERLRLGNLAITASGKPRPIRWIGTRSYPGLSAPKHDRPVRIKADALRDGVPARDLLVSPDHCLWLDGLLVAAGHLVNGTSITRGEPVADLTYWHVELDSHDMLLADGAAAESFLAAPGVRAGFDGIHRLDLTMAPVPYAVRTERTDAALNALRERLIVRAGLSIKPVRFGAVRAWMDKCDGRRVAGWAQDAAHPDAPMCLDILVDGAVVAMTLAEEYRADIAAAGVGDGCHGFDVDLDEPLVPGVAHTVEVCRSADSLRICAMAVDAAGVWTPLLAA